MKCPECQFDNRENAKFCKLCGAILKLKCPSCGYAYESGSLFCDQCGYRLGKSRSLPPADYAQPKSYTPKFLADKILAVRSTIEGERNVVTVLFADVANYTALAEKLDPEEVHQIMDDCFKILMDSIHTHEGTINQFTGDGIMALFGAPIAHENHAQRACYAALSIKRAIEDYGKQIQEDYGLEFKMRLGINSGLVIVGSIGDDLRMDYTAVGDTTNLAKRMESIAEPGNIVVAENTYLLIKPYFELDALGPVAIKGKEKTQHAYSLIDSSQVRTRFEATMSKGLVRFVGRKNSLGTLINTWNKATEGFGQVLGVMGEPGVGKSRLILQFTSSLFDHDINCLNGRCLPHGRSIAYLPLVDILKSYFMITEDQSEFDINKNIKEKITLLDKQLSRSILPVVQQLLSLEIDDEAWPKLEPQQRRKKTFKGLKNLFICFSRQKPLIIIVDDLQWVDRTSEEFLSYFIDNISLCPIFLILLYRPEYTHSWENKPHYNKLGLGQLTKKTSAELISAILDNDSVSVELEQFILQQSAGNPLFIEEFIYALLENNYIKKKNNQIVLTRRFDRIRIPDTIYGIVADRMDKLGLHLKQILQVASVIGQDFGYGILQAVTGVGDELKPLLDNLQSLDFINMKQLLPEVTYTFKHALLQEVAYNNLLLKRRTELHAKVGSTTELLYANRLEEFYEILAHHYLSGKVFQKAYQYLKLSGKKAEGNFSHSEAFNFFKKALKIHENLPITVENKSEKLETHNLMLLPIAMLGYPKGSLKILEAGVKIAKQLGDQKSLARFYNNISLLHTARGNSLLSIANREKSFQEAKKIEDIEMMANVALSLCYAYASTCQYGKLIKISLTITELIEKTGRESEFFNTPFNLYAFVLALCGTTMGIHGNFREAKPISEKGLNHALRIGDATTLAFTELQHASLLVLSGNGRAAITHCQNSIKYSEDTEWPTILSQAWSLLGYANYLIGDLEQARTYAAKGLKIQEDSGIEAMLSMHYWMYSLVLYAADELEDALQCVEKTLDLSKKNNEKRYEGLSKILIGKILGSKNKGKYKEGERFILEGCQILKELSARPAVAQSLLDLGELYINSGELDKAVTHLETAKSMFEEMEMDYWSAKVDHFLEYIGT
jgi:predicted ATPase/class 3 adenylate cyclase